MAKGPKNVYLSCMKVIKKSFLLENYFWLQLGHAQPRMQECKILQCNNLNLWAPQKHCAHLQNAFFAMCNTAVRQWKSYDVKLGMAQPRVPDAGMQNFCSATIIPCGHLTDIAHICKMLFCCVQYRCVATHAKTFANMDVVDLSPPTSCFCTQNNHNIVI